MVGRSLVDIQRHLQEAAERETDAGRMVAKLADAVAEELRAQGDALAEELQEREEISARKIDVQIILPINLLLTFFLWYREPGP